MDEMEKKLPKWAQEVIKDLRREVSDLDNQLLMALGKTPPEATGKVVVDASFNRPGYIAHDRAIVSFLVGGEKVDVMLRENATLLDINCSGGTMHILPRAANCCYIKPERD